MTRRPPLPPNTVEVVLPLCYLPTEVCDRVFWAVTSFERQQPHVPGLHVEWTDTSIGTQGWRITWPCDGEQVARSVHDRFRDYYGVPARYLRVRDETARRAS